MTETTEKVIADESTGKITCQECGETFQSARYNGSIMNLIQIHDDLDKMATKHAAIHNWK